MLFYAKKKTCVVSLFISSVAPPSDICRIVSRVPNSKINVYNKQIFIVSFSGFFADMIKENTPTELDIVFPRL